jgi:hypothetical protein
MAANQPMESLTLPQRNFSPVAGLLSYLVPGLGQIVQGRIAKGLLFFCCLYFLFFFGEYLGGWRNVYIADTTPPPGQIQQGHGRLLELIADRARFFAQFWIGVAAWPAFVQWLTENPFDKEHPVLGNYQRRPTEREQNTELRNSDKSPDVGWMYTVIAGVLNVLVIYDALAGPVHFSASTKSKANAETKEPAVA